MSAADLMAAVRALGWHDVADALDRLTATVASLGGGR